MFLQKVLFHSFFMRNPPTQLVGLKIGAATMENSMEIA